MPIYALLMFAALMIGHHFSISDLWNAPSASGVAPTLLALADERSNNCMSSACGTNWTFHGVRYPVARVKRKTFARSEPTGFDTQRTLITLAGCEMARIPADRSAAFRYAAPIAIIPGV